MQLFRWLDDTNLQLFGCSTILIGSPQPLNIVIIG